MDGAPFHEHCQSCISRYCQFEVVKDVSCIMVFCENGCGNKFHVCKQYDHNERCPFLVIDCINKQYGCPKKFKRGQLSKHLEVCPANVLICTMEWNRWHHGSLISKFDWKQEVDQIKDQKIVDKNLDIACSIHDQSILLETAMPKSVLKYYSDLADGKNKEEDSIEYLQENNVVSVSRDEEPSAQSSERATSLDSDQECNMHKNREEGILSTTRTLLKYIDGIQTPEVQICGEVLEEANAHQGALNDFIQIAAVGRSADFDASMETRKMESQSVMMSNFREIDAYIRDFQSAAPGFMSLLNALDSDACIVINVMDDLLDRVVTLLDGRLAEGTEIPTIDWKEEEFSKYSDIKSKCHDLCQSIRNLLQDSGVTHNKNKGTSSSGNEREKRMEKRKKRSWLFKSNIKSGGHMSASWGWMPRKQLKDASTDTSDLSIDKQSLEWLSPEAVLSHEDLVFRLFSIIGATSRMGSPFKEKQINRFAVESSCQTVAPFLLHLDMNSIGRALHSASFSSSAKNFEDRIKTVPLLTDRNGTPTQSNKEPITMSKKLKYNNLALGNVLESVPRYQTKPPSMYSFMCGCVMRRDQFSSHIQNIHCEIMSGMNGWIEQKCPYAAYGCTYSEPRFCPDHSSNAVVYDQEEGSFTVSPLHWDCRSSVPPELGFSHRSFVDLPYEVHERIFRFLDCYSVRQLSLTCSYLREFCKNHLVTRGVVETKWSKRWYDNGTTSWKMAEKTWTFPPTTTKISRWVLSDCPTMVHHVSKCPVVAECDTKYKEERVRVLPTE